MNFLINGTHVGHIWIYYIYQQWFRLPIRRQTAISVKGVLHWYGTKANFIWTKIQRLFPMKSILQCHVQNDGHFYGHQYVTMGCYRMALVNFEALHYSGAIMSKMVFQITSVSIVYSIVSSGADQRKHQSATSLAYVWGIHPWPVDSPQKGPIARKMFPFDYVMMMNLGMSFVVHPLLQHPRSECNRCSSLWRN